MVLPRIKFSLNIFIASRTALRMTGSLERRNHPIQMDLKYPSSDFFNIFPESANPHVVLLTKEDSLAPMCISQLALVNLSRINNFSVCLSGTRNNASAKHINKTPSSVDKS